MIIRARKASSGSFVFRYSHAHAIRIRGRTLVRGARRIGLLRCTTKP